MTDSMTVCDRCGSAAPVGANVCPSCGAPLGGVDRSVSGVPVDAVSSQVPILEPKQETYASDLFGPGAEETVGEGIPTLQEPPLMQGPPPAAQSQVFNPPPAVRTESTKSRLPWMIGCCLGAVLIGCLIVFVIGVMFSLIPIGL